jgi:hypothetical protein
MEADELQRVWQSQECGRQITVDADLVLKLVRRNYRNFRSMIFWRDVSNMGAAAFLVAFSVYWGAWMHAWPWFAFGVLNGWVGLFLLGDRVWLKWKTPTQGETLVAWTESSLASVEHQTRLLKNVLWSSLLPIWIGHVLLTGYYGFLAWRGGWRTGMYVFVCGYVLVLTAICYGVYRWNQYAVRTELQPRKQELQSLLENLKASG